MNFGFGFQFGFREDEFDDDEEDDEDEDEDEEDEEELTAPSNSSPATFDRSGPAPFMPHSEAIAARASAVIVRDSQKSTNRTRSRAPVQPHQNSTHRGLQTNLTNNVGSASSRGTRLQVPRPTPHGTLSRPNPAKPPRPGPGAPQAAYSPHTNPLKPSISYPDLSKTDSQNDTPVRSSPGPAIQQSSYHERARSHTPQPRPLDRSEPNHSVRNSPRQTSGKNQLPGSALMPKRPAPQVVPQLSVSDPGAQGRPDIANSTESTVISTSRSRNPNNTNLPTYPRVGGTGQPRRNTQEWPTATEPRPPTSAPVPPLATHGTYSRPSDHREYNASQPPSQGSEILSNAVDTNAASEQRDNPAAINIYHIHNVKYGHRLHCLESSAQRSEVYGSHSGVACAKWQINGLGGSSHMLTILNVGTNLYAASEPLSGKPEEQALVAKGRGPLWHFEPVRAIGSIYAIQHHKFELYWKMSSYEDREVVELLPGPPSTHEYHWVIQKKQTPGDGGCGWNGCE